MIILLFLIISLTLAIIGFSIYLLMISKHNQLQSITRLLNKMVYLIFSFAFLGLMISFIVSLIYFQDMEFALIESVGLVIRSYFLCLIAIDTLLLVKKLQSNDIFNLMNVTAVKRIGQSIILMATIELLSGFSIGLVRFITGFPIKDFTISIQVTPILFITFGFILYLLSMIYAKAIDIYTENQLTI